jgi:hypothetical protein
MRAFLTITLLIIVALEARARTAALEDSLSPNHRYRVQVAESGKRTRIIYQIVRRRDASVIHSIESSYQPQEGELPDWSWNHSTEAEVSWSSDSRYVSIDEQVHNYIGEVLLAEITESGAQDITLPADAILLATKRQWDRHRIRHRRGWISDDRISLVFAGQEAQTYKQIYLEIILRIEAHKATVISCRDITNET